MTKQEERARFLEMAKEYFGDDCLTWPYNTGSNGRAKSYAERSGNMFNMTTQNLLLALLLVGTINLVISGWRL